MADPLRDPGEAIPGRAWCARRSRTPRALDRTGPGECGARPGPPPRYGALCRELRLVSERCGAVESVVRERVAKRTAIFRGSLGELVGAARADSRRGAGLRGHRAP